VKRIWPFVSRVPRHGQIFWTESPIFSLEDSASRAHILKSGCTLTLGPKNRSGKLGSRR
jgi:hypothetical protein